MATNKRKTRLYEPWGYRDQDNYQSSESIIEDDFNKFFADASYKKDDNKIHFKNKDGKDVATIDVSEFVNSGQVIEKAWYKDGKIYIKFTNGDLLTIDVKELIDENEFKDGLQVVDGIVSVLIDPSSEKWISVSENGVKVTGIQEEIDRLDEKVSDEEDRAREAESLLSDRIDSITSGSTVELDELIEKLGYKDNDTLITNNEHEVAFGEWNVSHNDSEPSGQTIFSIGIGTADDDRKNAFEVMKNGDVYMWIEGDYMNINKLLGQIAHETYN